MYKYDEQLILTAMSHLLFASYFVKIIRICRVAYFTEFGTYIELGFYKVKKSS